MDLENLKSRFFVNIAPDPTSTCILWAGSRRPAGYGLLSVEGQLVSATHVSWRIKYGEWPDQHVLHRCDNPPCVNPDHLFLGSDQDNAADRGVKGRSWRKLDDLEVSELLALTETRMSIQEIADRFGVTPGYVSNLRHGRYRGARSAARKPTTCTEVEIDGKAMTIAQAVTRTGLSQNVLRRRIERGLTGEALVAKPHAAPRKPYVRRK